MEEVTLELLGACAKARGWEAPGFPEHLGGWCGRVGEQERIAVGRSRAQHTGQSSTK